MATPGQVLMPAAVLTASLGAAQREPMRAPWLLPMEGGRIIPALRNAMNQGNPYRIACFAINASTAVVGSRTSTLGRALLIEAPAAGQTWPQIEFRRRRSKSVTDPRSAAGSWRPRMKAPAWSP